MAKSGHGLASLSNLDDGVELLSENGKGIGLLLIAQKIMIGTIQLRWQKRIEKDTRFTALSPKHLSQTHSIYQRSTIKTEIRATIGLKILSGVLAPKILHTEELFLQWLTVKSNEEHKAHMRN